MTALLGLKPLAFPAQIRIVFADYVAIGTFAPGISWMMWMTIASLGSNLFVGW